MVEDAIRQLFWAIAKLMLALGDWVYEILYTIISIDLSNSKIILYTWSFMLIFLSFATILRIAFVLLHKIADDDNVFDIGNFLKKLGSVFLVIALSTTMFTFCLGVPKYVVNTYNNVINYDERMIPSTAVISATAKTPITASLDDMSVTDEVISINTIDDNLNEKENGDYIYFIGYPELLLCMVASFIVTCMQINIVTDTIIRLFLNIFRFVIGFIPISSLVEEQSTCGDWFRDILSDMLVMMCLPIFTNMVFGFMSTSAITSLNGIVRIVVFAVALMAVSKSAELIAKYMQASNLSSGGHLGTMLLAMGAGAALNSVGSVLKGNSTKYRGSKGSNSHSKSNTTKTSNNERNSGPADFGSYANNGGEGLGSGLDLNNSSKESNYFAGSKAQDSFQGGSSVKMNGDSILDSSPTSKGNNLNVMSAGPVGTGKKKNARRSAGNSGGIGSRGARNNYSKTNNVSGGGQSRGSTKIGMKQGEGRKNSSKSTGHVGGNAISNGLKGNNYTRNGRSNGKSNDRNNGIGSSAGFVDSKASGHTYKQSKNLYKKSAKERYGNKNSRKSLTDRSIDLNIATKGSEH